MRSSLMVLGALGSSKKGPNPVKGIPGDSSAFRAAHAAAFFIQSRRLQRCRCLFVSGPCGRTQFFRYARIGGEPQDFLFWRHACPSVWRREASQLSARQFACLFFPCGTVPDGALPAGKEGGHDDRRLTYGLRDTMQPSVRNKKGDARGASPGSSFSILTGCCGAGSWPLLGVEQAVLQYH